MCSVCGDALPYGGQAKQLLGSLFHVTTTYSYSMRKKASVNLHTLQGLHAEAPPMSVIHSFSIHRVDYAFLQLYYPLTCYNFY